MIQKALIYGVPEQYKSKHTRKKNGLIEGIENKRHTHYQEGAIEQIIGLHSLLPSLMAFGLSVNLFYTLSL